jgi:hypothetical protein
VMSNLIAVRISFSLSSVPKQGSLLSGFDCMCIMSRAHIHNAIKIHFIYFINFCFYLFHKLHWIKIPSVQMIPFNNPTAASVAVPQVFFELTSVYRFKGSFLVRPYFTRNLC